MRLHIGGPQEPLAKTLTQTLQCKEVSNLQRTKSFRANFVSEKPG